MVCLGGGHGGQGAIDGFAGHVMFDVSVRLTPTQRGLDALAEFSRDLGVGGPDRLEDAQDILATDTVDFHLANDWKRALFHALHPIASGLPVAPARPVRLERRLGGLPEQGSPGPPFLHQRIATVRDREAVGHGAPPRVRQRDEGKAAEAQVVTATVDHYSLDPGLRTALCDSQEQSVAVTVAARFGGRADARRCQFTHVIPQFSPRHL